MDRATLERELLAAHQAALDAHLQGNWQWFGDAAAGSFLLVNNGEIRRVTAQEQRQRFRSYLESVHFDRYADLEPPVVGLSVDGSLGWVAARVRAQGATLAGERPSEPIDQTWAWLMVYSRRDGKWVGLVNASNRPAAAPQGLAALPPELDPATREVLVRAQLGMGGELALAAVQSLESEATVVSPRGVLQTRVAGTFEGSVAFSQMNAAGERVQWFVAGSQSWQVDEQGSEQALDPRQRAMAWGHAFHLLLLAPTLHWHQPIYGGQVRWRDHDALLLTLRDEFGEPVQVYYDRFTHLPLGYVCIEPGSTQRTPITVVVSQWQPHGTLKLFKKLVIEHNQALYDYDYHSIVLNQVGPERFARRRPSTPAR